ncbi:MAG TPA: beta-galactosidase family protein [Bryobacteraceae bacterium]|nr:beta-galactosidase family protein [Bryobacteraceae bacterium]
MPLNRREFLATSLAAGPTLAGAQTPAKHSFRVSETNFLLDEKPFQIISGSMHYARVPRSCWQDRFRKARALGLNTICTYSFWNAHQPEPARWDFSGNLDVRTFIQMAASEGLHVIFRPGPYACAEWDFGGFPAWLLKDPDIRVRSTDPKFVKPAAAYLQRIGQEVTSLQISQGGPIILCQVENEYGSYGNDAAYKNAIRQALLDAGFDGHSFYTSDGPSLVPRGSFPDLPAVINFGANENTAKQFATLDKIRPSGPRMCGEYWVGWFDHWGETHNGMTVKEVSDGLTWMLSHGVSVNLYMFHGGTSFGFMAGANRDRAYQPDISSYDYDAPLDEAGRPTEKFFAVRDIIQRHAKSAAAPTTLPEPEAVLKIPRFFFNESAPLWSLLAEPRHADSPQSMESIDQSFGLILYRTSIRTAQNGTLEIGEARDYALLYQGGRRLGTLDRRFSQRALEVRLQAGATLDILIDAMGRVNFGKHLTDDRKGLIGEVTLAGAPLKNWAMYSLPLTDLSRLSYSGDPPRGPCFYRARIQLETLGYTFLDLRGWGKGYVWVNGHNLGRYWSVGPQRTMFVPAEWLRPGENELVVLDLLEGGQRSLEGRHNPIYDVANS